MWQAGQHQPDALAALVIGHDVLVNWAGQSCAVAAPPLTAKLAERQAGRRHRNV
jgi:hypothetical protein